MFEGYFDMIYVDIHYKKHLYFVVAIVQFKIFLQLKPLLTTWQSCVVSLIGLLNGASHYTFAKVLCN